MKNFLFAFGLLAASAAGAQADTAYSCLFNMARQTGSGTYNLIVLVDSQTGKATVADGLANNDQNHSRHKTPPEVQLKRQANGSQIFSWTEEDVRFGSYSSDISWRARIEADGAIDATYSVISYPPPRHYTGTCKIEKGEFELS